MYKISTLNKISTVGLSYLKDQYSVIEDLDLANGIIVRSADMHSMDFSPNLLAIARAGAGYNNIPTDKCAQDGIVVFNTPGANANAVKELVLAGMLLSSRSLPKALNWVQTLTAQVKETVEKSKNQFTGNELLGKTLGVVGLGAIGVMVANAGLSLGMKVIGYDPFITLKSAHALSNKIPVMRDFSDLLGRCDYVSIHVPVMEETKGMMDSRRFAQMKDSACLLNFARDTLVNDEAMLAAIASGKLKNYITDFPNEDVLGKQGVISIPHLGASTIEAEDNCATMAVNQVMDYIEKGNITNSVNYPDCSMGELSQESVCRVCILHKNIPAMLGKITGTFAELGINISDLTNKSKGDFAYTIMDVDNDISDDKLRVSLPDEDIIRIRVIK